MNYRTRHIWKNIKIKFIDSYRIIRFIDDMIRLKSVSYKYIQTWLGLFQWNLSDNYYISRIKAVSAILVG